MQAVREENVTLKQEMETLNRKMAEQVSWSKICYKKRVMVLLVFSPHFVFYRFAFFSLITGNIRVNSGTTPEHVRSI